MTDRAKDDNKATLGMGHAIAALFMMGYGVGSPQVAPMLPPPLERPFSNLHRELHVAGVKAIEQAQLTWQSVSDKMPIEERARQLNGLAAR